MYALDCNMVFMRQYEGDTVFLFLGNTANFYAVTIGTLCCIARLHLTQRKH